MRSIQFGELRSCPLQCAFIQGVSKLTIGSCFSVCISSYNARRKFGEHERILKLASLASRTRGKFGEHEGNVSASRATLAS